eukprot:5043270-Prymnesium_polylepis.2
MPPRLGLAGHVGHLRVTPALGRARHPIRTQEGARDAETEATSRRDVPKPPGGPRARLLLRIVHPYKLLRRILMPAGRACGPSSVRARPAAAGCETAGVH